jgi:Uncharacterised protein conserved in bacteria (DUF2336)
MESQNFFSLDGLTDLSKRSGIDMRPTLLRVLTDLYVHRFSHSADEERHYTELALRMLEAVDVPTRVAVAKRFARYLKPPPLVLQWLARDLPVVANEVSGHALLHIAAATPPAADAPREPATTASPNSQQQVREPAAPIDGATAAELNELFFAATAIERRLILLNLPIADPNPVLRSQLSPRSSIGQELEASVLTGKREQFSDRLAQVLRISHEQARRMANDELGEPILVAAKVLGLRRDVLYRILMFVNPSVGHSVERVHRLAGLYDELEARSAEGMLAIWQSLPVAERARFGQRSSPPETAPSARPRAAAAAPRQSAPPQTKESRGVS